MQCALIPSLASETPSGDVSPVRAGLAMSYPTIIRVIRSRLSSAVDLVRQLGSAIMVRSLDLLTYIRQSRAKKILRGGSPLTLSISIIQLPRGRPFITCSHSSYASPGVNSYLPRPFLFPVPVTLTILLRMHKSLGDAALPYHLPSSDIDC